MYKDFLLEIGTEELPPLLLNDLALQMANSIAKELKNQNLEYQEIQNFATPRRIAIRIISLATKQPDKTIQKIGPNIKVAFDSKKQPTQALNGFLKSNNVKIEDIKTQTVGKDEKVVASIFCSGLDTSQLLPEIITASINNLNFSRPMRWHNYDFSFIRPVHWIVCLLGSDIINLSIFNIKSSNYTLGHRFHSKEQIKVDSPQIYLDVLKKAYVIADFNTRKNTILKQLNDIEAEHNFKVEINPELLNEVNSLVEWPVALVGSYDNSFLELPEELIISELENHQRYFPVRNKDGKLAPYFVLVSNIVSINPETVIHGNSQVLSARLKDGLFLWEQDLSCKFTEFGARLADVTYQHNLGNMQDKVERIKVLSEKIAKSTSADLETVQQAASLCKSDLVSSVVFEFPELQGIIGGYYANKQGFSEAVAHTINQHYKPVNAEDSPPTKIEAACVSMADKLDHISVNFAIGNIPSGDKDFYALRRQALGVIKTIMTHNINVDLFPLIKTSLSLINIEASKQEKCANSIYKFLLDRMKYWYQSRIDIRTFNSIINITNNSILDIDSKVKLLHEVLSKPESTKLITNYKRVNNILNKNKTNSFDIDVNILETKEEKSLYENICLLDKTLSQGDYNKSLEVMMGLTEPLDNFFTNIMVMVEDEKLRNNRLALLSSLQNLFLQIADLSEL